MTDIQKLVVEPYLDKYLNDWCFNFQHISAVQARIIRGIMIANHMDDPSYKIRQKAQPFLEGYDDTMPGAWVMVSIASKNMFIVNEFCKYVETMINDPEQHKLWE